MSRLSADEDYDERKRSFRGPGGTEGGLGSFVLGFIMSAAGLYLILNDFQVNSGFWFW